MPRLTLAGLVLLALIAAVMPAQAIAGAPAEVTGDKGGGAYGGVVNGDFSSGRLPPWRLHSAGMMDLVDVVGERAVVTLGPSGPGAITQLWQKDIHLEGETTYVLRFDAMSDMGSNLRARVLQHVFPFENYGLAQNVNVQTRMRSFALPFTTPPGNRYDGRVSFLVDFKDHDSYGKAGEVYTFDNVSLEKTSCGDGVVTPEVGETCDPPAGAATELVVDGGFEAGPLSGFWIETSTNFGAAIYSAAPFEGQFHAWLGGTELFETGGVEQAVALPPDALGVLSFQLWLPNCSGDPMDFFSVQVDDIPVFLIDMTDARCGAGGYEEIVIDLGGYNGQVIDLKFYGETGHNGGLSNIFVDNVSISTVEGQPACRDDCTFCGDGILNGNEECDFADPGLDPYAPLDCSPQCVFVEPVGLMPYHQDFEGLDPANPSALTDDGWLVFANVFNADWSYAYGYGPFPAPNGGSGFSAIDVGQGGPMQEDQQLSVYSDYNNADHGNGRFIEANVFQEQVIDAADVGSTWYLEFNAKAGNIEGTSTALAFFKTLDPDAGFALTNFITVDLTGIGATWAPYTLQIDIDPSLAGQILQFGFANTATGFEGSGIFYDNVHFAYTMPAAPAATLSGAGREALGGLGVRNADRRHEAQGGVIAPGR